jgi:hypothetical protein
MSDLKELAEYVVEHPEAYEYRWRLAKKLYMAWEYHESLRHLLILKKNWTRRLNVLRYLAATLYRLGRYEEAVAELEGILAQWPTEVPVWEQLAKVHEVMGDLEKSAHAWEQVLRFDPDHSIAKRAIRRLRADPTPARDELHLADSDSGINLRSGKVCANCGAQNSDEFDRCWQCHASLAHHNTPVDVKSVDESASIMQWLRPLLGGLASVALFSSALYIALTRFPADPNMLEVPSSAYDALGAALYMPRAAIGGALAFASPVLLLAGFRITGVRGLNLIDAVGAGFIVAAGTYLMLWAPVPYQRYAIAAPAVATAFIVMLFLPNERMTRLAGAWILHTAPATVLGASLWFALVGVGPTREWPTIERFAQTDVTVNDTPLPSGNAPLQYSLIWSTTGSPWLDSLCGVTQIEALTDRENTPLSIELSLDGRAEQVVSNPPYRFVHRITPGSRYVLRIAAPAEETIRGTVRSLLPVITAS